METLAHTPAKVGQRFGVYNGDAKATLKVVTSQEVAYSFDHEPEVTHSHSRLWLDAHTFPIAEKVAK